MTQPAKSQEPSMEEILASIRRIIADDDAAKTAPPAPELARPAPRPVAPPPVAPPPITPPRSFVPPPEPEPPAPEIHAEFADADSLGEEDVEDEAADILDLTESMETPSFSPPPPPAPLPQFRKIEAISDVSFDEAEQRPPMQRAEAAVAPVPQDAPDHGLLSNATSAAVDSAFNTLAQTVLVKNARTLEDLVREMLRPMLKSWLDDNLPGMVERLVRAEIERVARGR
jgi:uncharacterized protein